MSEPTRDDLRVVKHGLSRWECVDELAIEDGQPCVDKMDAADRRIVHRTHRYCGYRGTVDSERLLTDAEFDAIARKEGYVRLDVLLVAADADLVLNNARCDLVDPTIKRQWALARKRLRSVLAALDPEGDT